METPGYNFKSSFTQFIFNDKFYNFHTQLLFAHAVILHHYKICIYFNYLHHYCSTNREIAKRFQGQPNNLVETIKNQIFQSSSLVPVDFHHFPCHRHSVCYYFHFLMTTMMLVMLESL